MTDIRELMGEDFAPQNSLYGQPRDNDLPEPTIPVGEVIPDRDGVLWRRDAHGWIVVGDGRPQGWETVRKWF